MDKCIVTVTLWRVHWASWFTILWQSVQQQLLVLQAASTVILEQRVMREQRVAREQQHNPLTQDAASSRRTCHECGKHFASRVGHKLHVAMHKGQYPYRCQHCGRGFSSTTNLKGHLVQHTGIKAFICHICKEEFKYRYMVKTHMERFHAASEPE